MPSCKCRSTTRKSQGFFILLKNWKTGLHADNFTALPYKWDRRPSPRHIKLKRASGAVSSLWKILVQRITAAYLFLPPNNNWSKTALWFWWHYRHLGLVNLISQGNRAPWQSLSDLCNVKLCVALELIIMGKASCLPPGVLFLRPVTQRHRRIYYAYCSTSIFTLAGLYACLQSNIKKYGLQ